MDKLAAFGGIIKRRLFPALIALLTGFFLTEASTIAMADQPAVRQIDEMPVVALSRLPPEVRSTLELIRRGGPFPYGKDGTIFRNREGRLPMKPKGYYREYTVMTPGISYRGPRRIVAGMNDDYYTGDHYRSFRRIVE